MLQVPDTIKDLLLKDNVRKNFRVHFPNGEREDIINDNIVFESVKFTESLCSRNELKFGLAEASTLRFTTVGVENIKGCTIEAQLEVDVSSLDTRRDVYIDDRIFVHNVNGSQRTIHPFRFATTRSNNVPFYIDNHRFSCYIFNLYNADSGYDTVYYTEWRGWVLDTIRSYTLEDEFPDISEENSYIYDIASGSLSRATKHGEYWNVTGVTNLKNPSSPNYSLYANGISDASSLDTYTSDDIPFPFFIIPYGSFRVDSCERQNDLKKRNIIAMTDVGKFFSLPIYEISKIKTAGENEIEYTPNLYGILSYYGIFSEYISDEGTTTLTEADSDHISVIQDYEDRPLQLTESWYLGKGVDGSDISISAGTRIPTSTTNYNYTVASSNKGSGYDDIFDIETVFKIDTLSEKELRDNTFDVNDTGFLLTVGAEVCNTLNAYTREAAARQGTDPTIFLLDNSEENLKSIGRSAILLSYAAYKYIRKENNYKTITTASVRGADTKTNGDEVYTFRGDLPTLFNNSGFDKYRVYPWFPNTAAKSSIVYNYITIPVLFMIRFSSAFGFALESSQGVITDRKFVAMINGSQQIIQPFVFASLTDYSGIPFYINDHVFVSSSTLAGYNMDYTPTIYKSFPSVDITKSVITEEKYQEFKGSKIELDKDGYYVVSKFKPKDWITAYMESKGLFCVFDRKTMCYKERSLRATYHTIFPAETLYPSPDLYPQATDIKIHGANYSSIWYAETLVGPIGGIKFDYSKSEPKVNGTNLELSGKEDVDGGTLYMDDSLSEDEGDLSFDPGTGDKEIGYYPTDHIVYNYDFTGNKRTEDTELEAVLEIVKPLFEEIEDVFYMPATVNAVGVPWIEPGDYVRIKTRDDAIETIVLRRTLSGIHLLKDTLESK